MSFSVCMHDYESTILLYLLPTYFSSYRHGCLIYITILNSAITCVTSYCEKLVINMNALLDYGSSSSDSEEDSTENDNKLQTESAKPKLPKPTIGESSIHTSVFSNPFAEAELAKAAILEKHVKMVPGKDNTQMINGKRICWNYRKGRCRFGHNCKFAHDTDIQKSQEEMDADKQKLKAVVCEGMGTMTAALPPLATLDSVSPTDDAVWEGGADKKKLKRPGLSQTLVPGKKVLKMYRDQKIKDAHKN